MVQEVDKCFAFLIYIIQNNKQEMCQGKRDTENFVEKKFINISCSFLFITGVAFHFLDVTCLHDSCVTSHR